MRARLACLCLLVAVLAGDAEARSRKPAPPALPTLPRIAGASSLVPAPWGLVALGGPKLRILPAGKKAWQTLHTVKGDNLYRVAADPQGRLLAAWEHDADIHLFVPATREHQSFAKPPSPGKPFISWSVDDLFFDDGGKSAILYMHGYTGGYSWAVAAYRYALDGASAPVELFRQPGYQMHATARLSVFMLGKDPSRSCDGNGCEVASLVAWEITDGGARKQLLLDASKRELIDARLIRGSDGDRVAIVVDEYKMKGRQLLRWRRGDARVELQSIAVSPGLAPEVAWLDRSGDVLELWIPDDRALEIWRFPAKGERQVTRLAPLPQTDPEQRPLFAVYGFKERKNGGFVVQWGEYIYLLPADGASPPRRVFIQPLFKKNVEWAGAFIYVPEPEGVWIGIEGGGRSFTLLTLEEIEKRAAPVD